MIEREFDVPFVADLALREKQIQQNYRPIMAVHKWFARRPGTLFRSLILSEFVHGPLRQNFYQGHSLGTLSVLDPFTGGGTTLKCTDAAEIDFDRKKFDAVLTDPPYFRDVEYAELMDFCYGCLRKLITANNPRSSRVAMLFLGWRRIRNHAKVATARITDRRLRSVKPRKERTKCAVRTHHHFRTKKPLCPDSRRPAVCLPLRIRNDSRIDCGGAAPTGGSTVNRDCCPEEIQARAAVIWRLGSRLRRAVHDLRST